MKIETLQICETYQPSIFTKNNFKTLNFLEKNSEEEYSLKILYYNVNTKLFDLGKKLSTWINMISIVGL